MSLKFFSQFEGIMTHHEVVKDKGRINDIAFMHLNSLGNGQHSGNTILRRKTVMLESKGIFFLTNYVLDHY